MVENVESAQSVATPAPAMPSEKPAVKEIQPAVETASEPTVIAESVDLLGLAQLFPAGSCRGTRKMLLSELSEEEIDMHCRSRHSKTFHPGRRKHRLGRRTRHRGEDPPRRTQGTNS